MSPVERELTRGAPDRDPTGAAEDERYDNDEPDGDETRGPQRDQPADGPNDADRARERPQGGGRDPDERDEGRDAEVTARQPRACGRNANEQSTGLCRPPKPRDRREQQ